MCDGVQPDSICVSRPIYLCPITYLALSHYHDDHTGNANDYAGSTWLVQRAEYDAMFAEKPPPIADIRTYSSLRNSKKVIIENRDHDVFGDGTVVLKFTPGHTPGSQMLFVRLAKAGPVLLTGDPYSSDAQRVPPYDTGMPDAIFTSKEQAIASRTAMEAFVKQTGTTMWVHHDVPASKALKKSPEYYDNSSPIRYAAENSMGDSRITPTDNWQLTTAVISRASRP